MADLTAHVHKALAKHYPPHVLGWVKRATWKRDPAVPLSRIDMSRRPGGRDPQKVAGIAQAVKDGKPMPPVVLVDTGEGKLQIADGYHRTLGFQHAGKAKIPALIASGVGAHGPWEKRMHDAKLNLTAGRVHVIDLAGTCTGPGPCDTSSFGEGKNWVNSVGGLPDYIRAVAHAFRRKGLSESEAIQRAVGVVKNWAEGKGGVTAATRARAAKAVAEWEAKKAASHSLTAAPVRTVDLAMSPAQRKSVDQETAAIRERAATAKFPHKFVAAEWTHPNGHPRCKNCGQEEAIGGVCEKPTERTTAGPSTSIPLTADSTATVDLATDPVSATTDGPSLTIPAGGGHRYHHGWIRIDTSAPTAVERATRAVTTDGHALLHGAGMVPAAQRVIERVKAAGHTPSVKRVDVAGTPHLHIARQRSTDYTAAPVATVDLAFTEQLHPRAPKGTAGGGRFAPKNSASGPPSNMAANVRDFQRRTGLPVTGVIDPTTAAKIRAELTAKGGGGRKGSGKTKARKAAAAAKRQAKAATRAQKQQTASHVATVNAMTPVQRAAARTRMSIPPTGYVWTPTNTLRRFP